MDLVFEANTTFVCPFSADDHAGMPGWHEQPAFPVPGFGGETKERLPEHDGADVVIGVRFHKHKRLAKAVCRCVDLHRVLPAGPYR